MLNLFVYFTSLDAIVSRLKHQCHGSTSLFAYEMFSDPYAQGDLISRVCVVLIINRTVFTLVMRQIQA